jgi:phosphoserine phosphatase RsbU/P
MTLAVSDTLRQQLENRRTRLRDAVAAHGSEPQLVQLLTLVDAALDRLGTADYAPCLVCHEHVSEQDLLGNPLMMYCLCDLSPEQQRALEHDLEVARRIQAGLLPDPDVRADGWQAYYRYEPAGVVSGDYCDLWQRPEEPGTVYFAVGDVSGKGVAASLLMAHLQAAFRSLVGAGVPLPELVSRVNRQLLQASLPSHYATLACGRASAGGDVEIVNAGHCPPLVVRRHRIESVGSTGFPIGLVEERPYGVTRLRLAPAEALVLHTDGITEARRGDGEEYGQERLERALAGAADRSPRVLVHALRSDVAAFVAGAPPADDTTVLALGRSVGGD